MRDEHSEGRTATFATSHPVSRVIARPGPGGPVGPFPIGHVIDRVYEVKEILGAGGMGIVYDAFDHGLRRRVAIKAGLAPAFAEALRNEAHALAALHSPSFVEVYALGAEDENEFIVMERLYGERLDQRLADAAADGSRLPLDDVLDTLAGIAKALAAAHGAGISQRDVKPSNVIVAGSRVVLFDFGLAIPEVLVCPTTLVSGSVEYLAPELILGELERGGGPFVDLYALGIVAFELLAGAPPFTGDSVERILSRHVGETPPDVRDLRADLPSDLAILVNELLEKDPKARPAMAESVVWQLEEIKRRSLRPHRSP
jgi:serine/threonine-protein kinase